MVEGKCIKFAAKVKEIDRQYEANNNADLDNGVYHQDSEEEKKEEKKKTINETSFDMLKGLNEDLNEEEQLQKELEASQ